MAAFEKPLFTRILSGYTYLLLGLFGSAPMLALTYLEINRQPGLLYAHHGFHIIAISIAIAIGAFITFVTWRCYADSGEPFLRWLTLGFLGFTLIYAPHGLFTPLALQNPWLFLLYGPASRVVMAACFLTAMFHYAAADAPSKRWRPRTWLIAIAIFIGIDLAIGLLAISPLRAAAWLRLSMEYTAIGLFVIVIAWLITQRIRNPLMVMYAVSMAWFAQSSLAFSLDTAWSHQWWLAHVIFAGGFFLLSYGVIQAYLSTRSFARVYSQAELLEEVLAQKQRAEETMVELQRANAKLERLAATDPLTGAANRRELMQRAEQEAARAVRNHAPLSLIAIDLDHFKAINDQYNHQVGDAVLKEFVHLVQKLLRPSDLLSRTGGEEFAVLLPDTDLEEAGQIAERLRQRLEHSVLAVERQQIGVTISLGVAQYHHPNETIKDWFNSADTLLYQAKRNGRNRVEVEPH